MRRKYLRNQRRCPLRLPLSDRVGARSDGKLQLVVTPAGLEDSPDP
jgi:hypothetical protein